VSVIRTSIVNADPYALRVATVTLYGLLSFPSKRVNVLQFFARQFFSFKHPKEDVAIMVEHMADEMRECVERWRRSGLMISPRRRRPISGFYLLDMDDLIDIDVIKKIPRGEPIMSWMPRRKPRSPYL
jgi:hypothetical protein